MIKNLQLIATIAGVMALVFGINNLLLNGALEHWGIIPRSIYGLPGIIFSPFLHANTTHLLNNLVGFSVFSGLVMLHGRHYYLRASAIIIIWGGLGVWIIGRPNIHIGASGWIFGLWALCIANAWYSKSFKNFIIAALVIIVWGGMIIGVVPKNNHISFEAHLMGAIAGIFAAATARKKGRR